MTTHNIHTSINSKDEYLIIYENYHLVYPYIRYSKTQSYPILVSNKAIMRQTRRYSFVSHPSIFNLSRFGIWEGLIGINNIWECFKK